MDVPVAAVATAMNRRRRVAVIVIVLAMITAAAGSGPVRVPSAAVGPLVDVIVRYDSSAGAVSAERLVARLGGTVSRRLDIIDGLAATLPVGAVAAARAADGVQAVTLNAPVRLNGDAWRADKDLNSLYGIARAAGVHDAWSRTDPLGRKITGVGVGVALIDSGVVPVKGLAATGKVVNGPDLSFESQVSTLRYRDTYGHGTHIAGIIAGRDPEVAVGKENDSRYFVGIAPGAHLINMKVASADGATDVSQVIAAIDWVVAHRNDPGLNIKVLNLSFGTDSVQDARLDPLSYAVEVAWRKGIVVVAAVGNDGAARTRVTMPAANPYVITVGAADPMGTEVRTDDKVASFSTLGNATRHADILAPGRSIVSLRDPGSFVDVQYPAALVGDAQQRFFRGSGTSQAAAVVSGVAALLLQQRPTLTPDQVKRIIMTSRQTLPSTAGDVYATGQLDVKKAIDTATPTHTQTFATATGLGTLEGARGSFHVADALTGTELRGEWDIFGKAWRPTVWSADAAAVRSWTGGNWNTSQWTGSDWTGTSWTARTWSAGTWTARTWSGSSWTARTWSDAYWTGTAWSARTWSSSTWTARTWSGGVWAGSRWP
jgi:serine protease AprX